MSAKNTEYKADLDSTIITMSASDLYNYLTPPVENSPIWTGLKTVGRYTLLEDIDNMLSFFVGRWTHVEEALNQLEVLRQSHWAGS